MADALRFAWGLGIVELVGLAGLGGRPRRGRSRSRDGGRQGSGQHAAGATSRSAGDRLDGTGPEDAKANDGPPAVRGRTAGGEDNGGTGVDPDNIRYGDQTSPDNGGPVRRR